MPRPADAGSVEVDPGELAHTATAVATTSRDLLRVLEALSGAGHPQATSAAAGAAIAETTAQLAASVVGLASGLADDAGLLEAAVLSYLANESAVTGSFDPRGPR